MLRAIKYELNPTNTQKMLIKQTCGCCRKVYNTMLDRKISAYKELDVARTVSVYGMTFEASWDGGKNIKLTYRPEREDYFGSKEYSSVEEAREAYKAAISAIATKEYKRYMQPTEEELRTLLLKVKEEYAPNSEIKKTTIGGVVRKTIIIVDTYQIGNYEIEVIESDGIDLITIHNIPVRM